ncbi:MAG: type III pantothenate kinase [Deltaproteobacteria bacterium]|nr:type III pantothenate kinase [Deltaproteobacteria bacterium]
MGEMSLLVVDIGNTNVVMGVFTDEKLTGHWRIVTDRDKTEDEYGILISQLLSRSGINIGGIDSIVISSVVPPLTFTFEELARKYFGKEPLTVEPGIRTGIKILYDNPREVGADRIANAVGAFAKYGSACIVVDFGTATTFDLISSEGDYIGGVIAPGINISAEALFKQTSKLPRVDISKPISIVGKNTVESIKAGIFYGYVSLVDGIVDKIKREFGKDLIVIATGGFAKPIAHESDSIDLVDENLTLDGLRIIYVKNKKNTEEA